jgi:hypothetical protein
MSGVPLTFASLREFHNASAARAGSAEVDYGRPWLTGAFGPGARVAWLAATGELFAVRLGGAAERGGQVELLAHVPDEGVLASMLGGWQAVCGTFDSMRWLRSRVANAHPLKRRYGWPFAA